MITLYSVKIRTTRQNEHSGKDERVNETYLFNALTFTEAEALAYKVLEEYVTDEFAVTNIRRVKAEDIYTESDAENYYKVTLEVMMMEEKSFKEKKGRVTYIVSAGDTTEAAETVKRRGLWDDGEVVSVQKYAIAAYIDATIVNKEGGEDDEKQD